MVDRAFGGNVLNFPTMPKKIDFIPVNRLRALRVSSKQSLAIAAKGCNTTIAQIQKLEVGDRDLDYPWMLRLAHHYQIPPADLLLSKDGGLTPEERHVIDTLREIPKAARDMFMSNIESQQPHRKPAEPVADAIPIEPRLAS